ncbi:thermonuclease family protein [candidate division KSB1 bacterium]
MLFPRSETWSVKCRIYRITETSVIIQFPERDVPSEIMRTSIKKLEYEDGRVVFFNRHGQIEAEIAMPMPVRVDEVKSIGIIEIRDGQEVILNGIDYTMPSDSLRMMHFRRGLEFVRSQIEKQEVSLQFDLIRRDEFGRLRAYVVLNSGLMLNMEVIRRGYCKVDRSRPVIYLNDFIEAENQAKENRLGIWKN